MFRGRGAPLFRGIDCVLGAVFTSSWCVSVSVCVCVSVCLCLGCLVVFGQNYESLPKVLKDTPCVLVFFEIRILSRSAVVLVCSFALFPEVVPHSCTVYSLYLKTPKQSASNASVGRCAGWLGLPRCKSNCRAACYWCCPEGLQREQQHSRSP